jgi:hypothetical protein
MKTLSEQAEHFAIWRMGQINSFECTYGEVSTATGVPISKVRRHCIASRWRFTEDEPVQEVDFSAFVKNDIDLGYNHV